MSAAALLWCSVLAHMVGDYVIQTDHMAVEKLRRWSIALLHGAVYTLPFVPLAWFGVSPLALVVIGGTHAVIDRYRLARYLVWAKNQLAPKRYRYALRESRNGYPADRPEWLSGWLVVIADNVLHVSINAVAVLWL